MSVLNRFILMTALACAGLPSLAQESRAALVLYADDAALREQLEAALPNESEPQSTFEARRQAQRAATRLRDVLNSKGYLAPQVDFAVDPGPPLVPKVRVDPGERFRISNVTITFDGNAPRESDLTRIESAHGLETGDIAEARPVLDGEGALVKALRAAGYPDASMVRRDVVGDRDTARIEVTYVMRAGVPA